MPAPEPRPRSAWIIPFVLGAVVISDRAFVLVASGGQGVLPILPIVALLAAGVALWRSGAERALGFLAHPAFVVGVLPFLFLTAILPVLGVMFHGYPDRTLLSITDATTAASFLVLGAAASANARSSWNRWLLLAIVVECGYALAQAVNWSRGPGWELFAPFAEWDRSLAALEGQLGSAGRSTGLFTNPNELGLWAAVAAVLAWTLLGGRQRAIGVGLAVLTLLLSQARGPAVGLLAAVVVGVCLGVARGGLASSKGFKGAVTIALVGAGVVVALTLQVVEVPLDRFGALLQVLIEGPEADVNLASRLNLWSGVLVLNVTYPLGTWGSPELLLGAAVDSAWFRAFAQGSVFYLVALALLLLSGAAIRGSALGDALRLTAVILAVTGVTQTSLGAPATPLFWVLLGAYLQASIGLRRRPPAELVWPNRSGAPSAGPLPRPPAP